MIKTFSITSRNADDDQTLAQHIAGPEFYRFIWDWEQLMRTNYKYSDDDSTTWDKVREEWYRMKGEFKLPEDV